MHQGRRGSTPALPRAAPVAVVQTRYAAILARHRGSAPWTVQSSCV